MEKFMQVNSMNNYGEQIVKKRMSSTMVSSIVLSLVLIVFVIFIAVYLSGFFGWLVPVAILAFGLGCYLIYYIIKNSGIEYEYTFVVGEMRIDRIKGKSKRKKVTVFDVKSIDKMGKYIDPETGKKTIDTSNYELILKAAVDEYALDTYYVIIHDKVRQKPAILLFTPNERTIEMIKPYFSIALKKKFFMEKKKEEQSAKTDKTEKPVSSEPVQKDTKIEKESSDEPKKVSDKTVKNEKKQPVQNHSKNSGKKNAKTKKKKK